MLSLSQLKEAVEYVVKYPAVSTPDPRNVASKIGPRQLKVDAKIFVCLVLHLSERLKTKQETVTTIPNSRMLIASLVVQTTCKGSPLMSTLFGQTQLLIVKHFELTQQCVVVYKKEPALSDLTDD